MTLADPTAAAVLGWLATFLVHSTLWIAGAWLVARLVHSAAWRERLWKGALVGGLVTTLMVTSLATSGLSWRWKGPERPPVETSYLPGQPIVLQGSPTVAPRRVSPSAGAGSPEQQPAVLDPLPVAAPAPRPSRLPFESMLLMAWLLGAAVGLVHLGLAHLRLARALRDRRAVGSGALVDILASLAERAGLRRRPRLATSAALASPVALARGEIVVPERALTRLAPGEMETLLAHELAHLARRDPWWLLTLNVLRRALWFQPFLGLVTTRSMEAAELRCDELAARWTRGELALARCLAEVATWIEGRPASRLVAGMAERPSALVERVERLLKPRRGSRLQGALVGAWLVAMLGVLGCRGPQVEAEESQPELDEHQAALATEDGSRSENLGRVRVLRVGPATPEEAEALRQLGYVQVSQGDAAGQGAVTSEVVQGGDGQEQMVAFLDAQIAERRAEQEGLKPPHSRWQKLEREIRMLETQRDQILLGIRADAGEQGQVDTRGGSKLHVTTMTQGNTSMSTAAPHSLRLLADGSVYCVNTRLVEPGSEDDTKLVEHLAEIAAGMDRAPLDPAHPDGPSLPDGTLKIRIDGEAPHSLLQRTLEACARQEVQIWRFSLVLSTGEELSARRPLPFTLPHDQGSIPEAVEEEDGEMAPRRAGPVEVILGVASEGAPDELRLETDVDEQGRLEVEPRLGRVVEYRVRWSVGEAFQAEGQPLILDASRTCETLESLADGLSHAFEQSSVKRVVIDAHPGILYVEVAAVLDRVHAAGFEEVAFTGRRR